MEDTTTEGTETPTTEAGDRPVEGEPVNVGEEGVIDHLEVAGEGGVELEGEHLEGENVERGQMKGEHLEEEHVEGEHVDGEQTPKMLGEGDELMGEELEGEYMEGEQDEEQTEKADEEMLEEEEQYVEPPPPDPAAPYDFSDSKEALREPFELRPDQVAEVEQLWEIYQDYTPAYTDIDNYITVKELVYMLKALMLMTYTPEQLEELVEFCVRPPHPEGHINYEQFLRMVTIRQRDFVVEEELRSALQVFDPEKTGLVDRDYLREILAKEGHKMPQKLVDNLIKEVDMTNDGTIGVEDVVGTLCIDLNKEDLQMLRDTLNPPDLVV